MPKETKFLKKTEKYIETGSYEGGSIQLAIDSGFSEIYSIELDKTLYEKCVNRFKENKNIHLLCGDSSIELLKVLKENPNTPFTYWLDAHSSHSTPLIAELEMILSRPVLGELIYVDDMRLYNNFNSDVNIEKITQIIQKYKPNAKISYEDDIWSKDDILVIDY
jgi:hypothetical protein